MATDRPTPIPADLAGAELWTDDYCSIWLGEPGTPGAVVVGDIVADDEEAAAAGAYPIRWLPADQRRPVRRS